MRFLIVFYTFVYYSAANNIFDNLQTSLNSLTPEYFDSNDFPEEYREIKEEFKCLIGQFKSEAYHKRVDGKLTDFFNQIVKYRNAYEGVTTDVEAIDFQKVHGICFEMKPAFKNLFKEVKVIFSDCVKNPSSMADFVENLAAKSFDFACNLRKKNFIIYRDGKIRMCMEENYRNVEGCSYEHNPQGVEFGYCE